MCKTQQLVRMLEQIFCNPVVTRIMVACEAICNCTPHKHKHHTPG